MIIKIDSNDLEVALGRMFEEGFSHGHIIGQKEVNLKLERTEALEYGARLAATTREELAAKDKK